MAGTLLAEQVGQGFDEAFHYYWLNKKNSFFFSDPYIHIYDTDCTVHSQHVDIIFVYDICIGIDLLGSISTSGVMTPFRNPVV